MDKEPTTTIKVKKSTRDRLYKYKSAYGTLDDIILVILNNFENP